MDWHDGRKNGRRQYNTNVQKILLIAPAMAVAEETLLLASLTRTRQTDEFKDYDFFPEPHQKARMEEKALNAEKMNL